MKITSKCGVTVEWITLNEKICKDLLDNTPENQRKIKEKELNQAKKAMRQGDWAITPIPIMISEEGWLMDGQHRITAFIEENYYPEALISTNNPYKNMGVIDTGAKRAYTDQFKIEGITDPATCQRMTNALDRIKRQRVGVGYTELTVIECVREYQINKDSIQRWRNSHSGLNGLCKAWVRGVANCYAEAIYSTHEIDSFWVAVEKASERAGKPTRVLMDLLKINNACTVKEKTYTPFELIAVILIAMNASKKRGKLNKKELIKDGINPLFKSFPYLSDRQFSLSA